LDEENAGIRWRWRGGSRSGQGSTRPDRSTNITAASLEKKMKKTASPEARDNATPLGRRSTRGGWRGSPGNTTTAPAAVLTSTTVPLHEWSVEKRRRIEGMFDTREEEARTEVSLYPRGPGKSSAVAPRFSSTSAARAMPLRNRNLGAFSQS
jgi:hypothetical protein